jgi:DNA-binding SARP family transcriptional activator
VQVRLLGPVDVVVDGIARSVAGLRRKAALAVLALRADEIVSVDHLVEVVWGENAPHTAAATLQNHVSYLRGVLGSRSAIVARPPGYTLTIAPDATDIEVAERLIRQGKQAIDAVKRATTLRAAVSLWRGRPLADVAGHPWLDRHAERLADLYLVATHALVEARLDLGEHEQLVLELQRLSDEYPYDEQFCGQLMLALYRAGRQVDALASYRELRRRLDTDLGIHPGPALRDLEARILQQDASLAPAPAIASVATTIGPRPAQLPPAVHAFTGRERELALLDAVLTEGTPHPDEPTAVVICAVSGTAGVGKTALAVHWAHHVAAQYPDGQLYVNLRGFEPGASAMSPAEAIWPFLDALGVPMERIPAGLDQQAALYRSVLAGKRVLVVLDNARDVEQVRPLLPGTPGCAVVVTSRDQLTPLVATEGAHPLTLDLLDIDDASELLKRRLGADRVAAEPGPVHDIIKACAGLPLALAIVAARAALRPDFPLAQLAAELRDTPGALNGLDAGDSGSDIRHVFSGSYRTLSPDAARLFRLLGVHPGPDISEAATSSLAGVSRNLLRPQLTELTRANLLTEHVPGRYTFHDLLRAYAAEQANTVDSEDSRRAARRRLFDHYLHSASAAARELAPQREHIALALPQPGVSPEGLADHDAALAWFASEHPVLVAAIDIASATGFEKHTWQLAKMVVTFLDRRGLWHDWVKVQTIAADAARRVGDREGQAHALNGLGLGYARSGRPNDAKPHY